MKYKILCVALVKNEISLLPSFIENNKEFFADFVFIDDNSSDGSTELIKTYGYCVVQNKFKDFATQRNFALGIIANNYNEFDAVFFLDLDEQMTNALSDELQELLGGGFYGWALVPPMNIMFGRKLPRSSSFPNYHDRFFSLPVLGSFKTISGGHIESFLPHLNAYRCSKTQSFYVHHFYVKGGHAWRIKHSRLAEMEASAILENIENGGKLKHRIMKLMRQLRISPLVRFCYHYFYRLGFLEGRAGYLYASNYALFERMILLQLIERKLMSQERR